MPPGFALDGVDRDRADRGDGRRSAPFLRRAVASGSHAHACRAAPCSNVSCVEICGCAADWEMGHIIDEAVARIREQVGNEHVILGLSGGVDSSVVAALLASRDRRSADLRVRRHRSVALERSRAGHGDVRRAPGRAGDPRRRERSASCAALAGVTDPEAKRKIIGAEFVEVFESEAAQARRRCEVAGARHDLSGRDRIGRQQEGKAHIIKSHHNVGGLPETLNLKLLEPLRELFKDEVRESASSSVCRARWCTAIRFRARAWACGFLAK